MTLLDNLTAQLSPDRKERFIELFRQLQVSLHLLKLLSFLNLFRIMLFLQINSWQKRECY